jgi:fatty acid desaturase
VDPRPISYYARALKGILGPELFAPVRNRLVWFALHVAVAVGGILLIAKGIGGTLGAALLAVPIGLAFGGLSFVGHETLHGAVVRSTTLRTLIGWVCFLPFCLSPRHWVAWHNKVHHGHAMQPGVDPDCYPTIEAYQESKLLRAVDHFSLGRGRVLGPLSLLLGFTGQSAQTFWRTGKEFLGGDVKQHRLALIETIGGMAVWAVLAWQLGALGFLFAYVIPLLIANAIVMAHILTNHSLSPLTDVNDPLLNSLSVTTPKWFSIYTLWFGLHVEHHLFPAMSSANAWRVRDEILKLWPERYQSMPIQTALAKLYGTARIYKSATVLVDPHSGREFPALMPRES